MCNSCWKVLKLGSACGDSLGGCLQSRKKLLQELLLLCVHPSPCTWPLLGPTAVPLHYSQEELWLVGDRPSLAGERPDVALSKSRSSPRTEASLLGGPGPSPSPLHRTSPSSRGPTSISPQYICLSASVPLTKVKNKIRRGKNEYNVNKFSL